MTSIRRIDRGRGHSYELDGHKVPGVTTLLQAYPKAALVSWAASTVGDFISDRLQVVDGHVVADDVLDDLRAIGAQRDRVIPDWRENGRLPRTKLADGFRGLPYVDRDAAANRGTEVHRLAEQLAQGVEVEIPDELKGHVESYMRFREEWRPHDELVEFVVASRRWRYCATADLACNLNAAPEFGRCLVEIKTNRSGPFAETALQLAGQRSAEVYLDPVGDERPMFKIDSTLCLWLRSDGYDLYPFEAGTAEFRVLQYVAEVFRFENERAREVKGEALLPPAVEMAS